MENDNWALLGLSAVAGEPVRAAFDGGDLTSDAGVLVLVEFEWRLGIAERLAGCLSRPRHPDLGSPYTGGDHPLPHADDRRRLSRCKRQRRAACGPPFKMAVGRLLENKLTRRRLNLGVFHSLVDLQPAINRFVAEHNAGHTKPFVWRADPNTIIAARNRGSQTLESIIRTLP